MERFPTWHIWRLLHTYPDPDKYEMLARVLHVKPLRFLWANNLWFWVVLGYSVGFMVYFSNDFFGGSIMGFGTSLLANSILPLIIAVVALHFAWQVTTSIIQLSSMGNPELIDLLSENKLMLSTDIARAHRYPFDGHIRGARSALMLVVALAIFIFAVILISSSMSTYAIAINLFSGAYSFVLYTQMFTTATLIAFLVSQLQTRSVALAILIGSYAVLYLTFAYASYTVSSNVTTWIFSFSNPAPSINARIGQIFWWSLVILPFISIAYHELVNFILWQVVKRRLEA